MATIGANDRARLVVLADNSEASDLYDDLHDIELLCKEAETGLAMLQDKARRDGSDDTHGTLVEQ